MNTKNIIDELIRNIGLVIKGKDEVISLFVAAFLNGGNVLIDDVTGV